MLPEYASYPTAFNNTALQYVLQDALPPEDDPFWRLPAERQEQDEDTEVL